MMRGPTAQSDLEAERAVLGCLLARHDKFDELIRLRPSDGEASDTLTPSDFRSPVHRALFVLVWSGLGNRPLDDDAAWAAVTRKLLFGSAHRLFAVQGGADWLADLMRECPADPGPAIARMVSLSREAVDG